MGAKLIAFFKKETILCVAGLLAVLSMAWIPPDGEYMGYINWQVLVLLFCLMSVMGGLTGAGHIQSHCQHPPSLGKRSETADTAAGDAVPFLRHGGHQ